MSTLSETVRVRLDEELRADLDRYAAAVSRSSSSVMRLALREYLARQAVNQKGTRHGR